LVENPLGKVVELLDSLAAKIEKEGEAEAKAYKEFFEWCDDAAANKKFEIKTATASRASLRQQSANLYLTQRRLLPTLRSLRAALQLVKRI